MFNCLLYIFPISVLAVSVYILPPSHFVYFLKQKILFIYL